VPRKQVGMAMIRPGRMTRAAGVIALALGAGLPAAAQDAYPTRTVRMVVGFGAGGPTDIPARFIADRLGTQLGQRVIVENKPGAAGQLATRDVLAQPRDGYHLLLCTHFEAINTVVYKNPGYRLADIAPISLISKYYYGLALANAIPAESFEQFLSYAKSRPGEVSYATIGAGSVQEIFARQLEKLTGISMNRVPFRTAPPVIQEMVAGRLHFFVSPTLSVMPQYLSKQLKVLAVTAPERVQSLPDVPTLKEKGLDFVRIGWLGICTGAGTPKPILDTLHRHIVAIVATPEYRELIEKGGSIPASSSPQELGQIIVRTVDDVASAVTEFGMQQQ
jgi:tripartite-type tricarboxylate transporter receptor subunit TctC